MQRSAVSAFFNQWRTWRLLEWVCLVAAVVAILALYFCTPSHGLATMSALFNFVGAAWLATGVYLSAKQVEALRKRKISKFVANDLVGASNKVWLAVLYFAIAAIAQIVSLFV